MVLVSYSRSHFGSLPRLIYSSFIPSEPRFPKSLTHRISWVPAPEVLPSESGSVTLLPNRTSVMFSYRRHPRDLFVQNSIE